MFTAVNITYGTFAMHLHTGLTESLSTFVQQAINSLQVLETLAPSVHPSLVPQLLSLLPHTLLPCMRSGFTAVRHMAARCVATLAHVS